MSMRDDIIAAIRTVHDPEIPINLYDLGLIYDLKMDEDSREVRVEMTLTTPNCPVAESMPGMVRDAVASVEGVNDVSVDLVWDPPWTSEMMSEDARTALDMMGISWKDPKQGLGQPRVTGLTVRKTGDGEQ